MNKVVIVDGNSLINRAYFALPPLIASDGKIYNAVYGFVNILTKLIIENKPTHLVVAFDAGKKTFRNDLYSDYKGTRKGMPEELASQLPVLKDLLTKMNIKIVEKLGIEADDIIGTLSKRFTLPCVILTGDRDCLQLIDNKTEVWLTKHGITDVVSLNERQLKEEMHLTPNQVIELKGLMGDASDNIPGVTGVGQKTALSLIEKYGTVENVYKNIDEINGKLKDKLLADKDMAFLSLKLATIILDADIQCEQEDCLLNNPFNEDVKKCFEKYEFASLLKRTDLFNNANIEKSQKKQVFIEKKLNNVELFLQNFKKSGNDKIAFLKTEAGYELAFDNQTNWVFENFDIKNFVEIFENENIIKVVHMLKPLLHELDNYNIKLNGKIFDVSLGVYLLNNNVKNEELDKLLKFLQLEDVCACNLLEAWNITSKQLFEKNLTDLYFNIELPLEYVLFDMEKTGIKINTTVLEELSIKYQNEINNCKNKIYELAGCEFNVNSSKQLADVLFNKLGLSTVGNKKQSTAVDKLEALAKTNPIVDEILKYRTFAKLNSTYVEGIKPYIKKDGKIHTTFTQTLTVTGRLSSYEPNLQNIPVRTEEGKELRKMFVPDNSGNVLLSADYSQIELRLLAHYSKDINLLKAYHENADIHRTTASQIFGVPFNEVTSAQRRAAKAVNFGIIYGISPYGLANNLGISPAQAKIYIDKYFETYPTIKSFMQKSVETAKKQGYISTLFGRRRNIEEIYSTNHNVAMFGERAAMNMPLQGTASDIVKLAMIQIFEQLEKLNLKTKMILQIHDELIFDVPKDELEQVTVLVKHFMENVVKLNVPLEVDINTGKDWFDCK